MSTGRVKALQRFKQGLTLVGAHTPRRLLADASSTLNYVRLGRWMRDQQFRVDQRVASRNRCFDRVADAIGDRAVLYLEFGVWTGASMRYWSKLLTHPDSRLHGFDSFEGLPETFDDLKGIDREHFDVAGLIPHVDDPRVAFHKGWFEDVLPDFVVPQHDQLVVCFDADLYSSTATILKHLDDWIVPGSYLYFDELAYIDHETRAFEEYMTNTGKRFELFVADWTLNTSVFRCITRAGG